MQTEEITFRACPIPDGVYQPLSVILTSISTSILEMQRVMTALSPTTTIPAKYLKAI